MKMLYTILMRLGMSPEMNGKFLCNGDRRAIILKVESNGDMKYNVVPVDKSLIRDYPKVRESPDKYVNLELACLSCNIHVEHIRMWTEMKENQEPASFCVGVYFSPRSIPYTFTVDNV